MGDEYLEGRLKVFFGIDTVYLAHKVHGRYSEMPLSEGDLVEVKDGENYKKITIQNALEKTIDKRFDAEKKLTSGKSIFQDCKARVKLNDQTTKDINQTIKRWKINELFHLLKWNRITPDEAEQILSKYDSDDIDE